MNRKLYLGGVWYQKTKKHKLPCTGTRVPEGGGRYTMEGTSREKKLEDQKSCVFGPFRLYLLAFSFRRGLVGRKSWKSNHLVFLAYQLYQLACSFLWGGLGGRKKLGIQLPCVFGPFQLSILEFPRGVLSPQGSPQGE